MNIVTFYAPRPDHFLFQDYSIYIRLLHDSCKKFGHRLIVITDTEAPSFDCFRVELPDNLMKAVLAGQIAYLESDLAKEDTVFIDPDCVFVNDPARLFADQEFDIALTTHPITAQYLKLDATDGTTKYVPFEDSVLNNGAMYVRGGADVLKFWRKALGICDPEWGGDQKALGVAFDAVEEHGLYERDGVKVRFLPEDPYNLAPEHPGQDCSHAVVLHFRGSRKEWAPNYCHDRFGYGPETKIVAIVNTSQDAIHRNVQANLKSGVESIRQQPAHNREALICGGGPSLADTLDEIKLRRQNGQIIVALNNVGNWMQERGIRPDVQVVVDARAKNAAFVEKDPAVHYLLASQCDPSVVAAAPADRTALFHCATEDIVQFLPKDPDTLVVGACHTAGLTSLALMYALGFRSLHLYGFDSSDKEGEAHAYPQEENEAEAKRIKVWLNNQQFTSSCVMFKQAEAFENFARLLINAGCMITVHGDGLLPAIAREMIAATISSSKPSE